MSFGLGAPRPLPRSAHARKPGRYLPDSPGVCLQESRPQLWAAPVLRRQPRRFRVDHSLPRIPEEDGGPGPRTFGLLGVSLFRFGVLSFRFHTDEWHAGMILRRRHFGFPGLPTPSASTSPPWLPPGDVCVLRGGGVFFRSLGPVGVVVFFDRGDAGITKGSGTRSCSGSNPTAAMISWWVGAAITGSASRAFSTHDRPDVAAVADHRWIAFDDDPCGTAPIIPSARPASG